MDRISELKGILGEYFTWNKARLDCFSRMLLALFAVRTVNLKEVAIGFASDAQMSSRYKRLKRFFAEFKIDQCLISKWIYGLFFSKEQKVYLTIDRTNWFWGKGKINILMIAIAYEGIAIPVCWKLLPKAGNASAKEHIAILKHFISIFGKEIVLGVLGDREFGSGLLFSWLNKQKIPFYIRIKEDSQVCIRAKKLCKSKKLFKHLGLKTAGTYAMSVWLFGEKLYLAGSRSHRGELMIVATNQDPRPAIAIYLRRWEIETLFQSLKSRGFRFEETHITKPERIEKLMSLLAIGFCWAHKVGEWRALKKPIVLNKYRDSLRPQYSYFRYGFDLIREAILHLKARNKVLKGYMKQMIFTVSSPQGGLL